MEQAGLQAVPGRIGKGGEGNNSNNNKTSAKLITRTKLIQKSAPLGGSGGWGGGNWTQGAGRFGESALYINCLCSWKS